MCDLIGNTWEFTDTFESERVVQYVLRGSSKYARYLAQECAKPNPPAGCNYYFPCMKASNGKDGGLRLDSLAHFIGMANSSYERSGMIGFRCAGNL